MKPILLTEKLLMDAGGWKAMKSAKALQTMGSVLSASYTPPTLRGIVREGKIEYRAGLVLKSATDIENLCTCRESRVYGTICTHSLAVGLEKIQKNRVPNSTLPTPATIVASSEKTLQATMEPHFMTDPHSEAVPLQLHIIFPPNLADAFAKGHVSLTVEAEQGGRNTPLATLSQERSYQLSGEDMALINKLRELTKLALPGMCILHKEAVLEIFSVLRGHSRVTLGRKQSLEIVRFPQRPVLRILENDGLQLVLQWDSDKPLLCGSKSIWLFRNQQLTELCPGMPSLYARLFTETISIPAQATRNFIRKELPVLENFFTIEAPASLRELSITHPPEIHCHLEGSLNYLEAHPSFQYQSQEEPDHVFEQHATERLRQWGFQPHAKKWELKGQNQILNFLAVGLPALQREWKITTGERFQYVTGQLDRVQVEVDIHGWGEDWFSLTVDTKINQTTKLDPSEVQRLLQLGQHYTRQSNGRIALIDSAMLRDIQSGLSDCNPKQIQPNIFQINHSQAAYLQETIHDYQLATGKTWQRWKQENKMLAKPPALQLGPLEAILRPYQKEGVQWLLGLSENKLGGILADDMGLGKTLQMLALLRQRGGKALVICPTSLLQNWKMEAEKFTPELRVLIIDGSQRSSLFRQIESGDIVLTSYALLRRDKAHYDAHTFKTIVLDEAHHIKNPDTQIAKAAFQLSGETRFVLTGTPMENSLQDLWSIFHFVMPGYLGTRKDFSERFEKPLRTGNDDGLQKRLARRLRPFLLRRLKTDVAKDLPEKLQQTLYCSLSAEQALVYREVLEKSRAKAEDAQRRDGNGQARIVMLSALTRLRQICCDLRLLEQKESSSEQASFVSGKTELFEEVLQAALDGSHRVLVFSQFVKMLHLLREFLERKGIEFCYLDGQTQNRQDQVEHFQTGNAPVFLISLKAGGVGLNLTAADTVIHFDPWWNPAVEDQATDRAHRIGQRNVVTAYKLITQGTVEERILSLQAKKRDRINAVIGESTDFNDGLTNEDLRDLLFTD